MPVFYVLKAVLCRLYTLYNISFSILAVRVLAPNRL